MNKNRQYKTKSKTETIELGKKFSRRLKPGDIIYLTGELGSGKTTFTKGICLGLGVKDAVTSPSFVIASEYQGEIHVSHIDLYRLRGSDLATLPIEEYYNARGVTIIEWADRLLEFSNHHLVGIYVSFKIKGKNHREICVEDLRN
jgi:tRNA threonylcarbamoyladenosine biosynthesis protein TsaE